MSLKNLDRDCFNIEQQGGAYALAWPTTAARIKTDGVINTGFASAQGDGGTVTTSPGSFKFIGVYMSMQEEEPNPFRVKAYHDGNAVLQIAYAPASVTTEDPTYIQFNIPFVYKFDDIVMLPTKDPAYSGRAIAFGVSPMSASGSNEYASISVQDLAVAPRAFAKGVS